MTVVSVAFNGTRLHDMGDTDGTTGVTGLGGGAGPGAEPDFVYQGSNSISRKVSTTLSGFQIDTTGAGGSADMDDPRNNDLGLWFFKIIATNKDALLADGSPALEVRIGPSSSVYNTIQISGNRTYPVKGGWLLGAITATLSSGAEILNDFGVETGTITIPPIVDYFAIRGDFNATSKGENVAMDAIDIGMGLTLTGGTGADPDGNIQSLVAADQGNSSNRWGAISEADGIVFSLGVHIIGATTYAPLNGVATVFTDSFSTVVFPETFSGPWTGFRFNLDDATTVITMSDGSLLGQTPAQIGKFNTETELSATTDAVGSLTNNLRDRFSLGTQVTVRHNNGTETPGVNNGTEYYVGYPAVNAGDITFHTTRAAALSQTSPVALTASTTGNGEIWMVAASLSYNSQPQLTFDNIGGVANFNRMLFSNFRQVYNENLADVTFTDCTFVNLARQRNNANGCTFEGCSFIGHNTYNKFFTGAATADPTSMMIHDDPGLFSDCSFDSGESLGGHAKEFTAAGTFGYVGNTYTNYPTAIQTLHEFDNTTDVNGTLNEITLPAGHGYVTGDGIVYDRRLTANTGVSGLSQDRTYFVNVVGNVMSLHENEGDAINDNAPVSLTAGTGNETHALWPANAAIFNSSGGLITLNVSGGGDTPSVRNTLDSTTVINNNISVTITGMRDNTEVRVLDNSTGEFLAGIENATAGTTDNRSFTFSLAASTVVDIAIFNINFILPPNNRIENYTIPTADTSLPVSQVRDRNYENP